METAMLPVGAFMIFGVLPLVSLVTAQPSAQQEQTERASRQMVIRGINLAITPHAIGIRA
jgi:hypothetical protein